jgi:hypothetical protein
MYSRKPAVEYIVVSAIQLTSFNELILFTYSVLLYLMLLSSIFALASVKCKRRERVFFSIFVYLWGKFVKTHAQMTVCVFQLSRARSFFSCICSLFIGPLNMRRHRSSEQKSQFFCYHPVEAPVTCLPFSPSSTQAFMCGMATGRVWQKLTHGHTRGTHSNPPVGEKSHLCSHPLGFGGFWVTRGFKQSRGEFDHETMTD